MACFGQSGRLERVWWRGSNGGGGEGWRVEVEGSGRERHHRWRMGWERQRKYFFWFGLLIHKISDTWGQDLTPHLDIEFVWVLVGVKKCLLNPSETSVKIKLLA